MHPTLALLAPVPVGLLDEGLDVCRKKGKVAFGSRAWGFFREIDAEREELAVETFIYASHTHVRDLSVTWHARYIGHVEGVNGLHPEGRKYRSNLALADGDAWWAVFWEVEGLERLETPIPIAELCAYATGEPYGKGFVPEGPMKIERPGGQVPTAI